MRYVIVVDSQETDKTTGRTAFITSHQGPFDVLKEAESYAKYLMEKNPGSHVYVYKQRRKLFSRNKLVLGRTAIRGYCVCE